MVEIIEIPISPCPICEAKRGHTYRLEIKKTLVVKLITALSGSEGIRVKRVGIVLTCPIKDKPFHATISIPLTSSEELEYVRPARPEK